MIYWITHHFLPKCETPASLYAKQPREGPRIESSTPCPVLSILVSFVILMTLLYNMVWEKGKVSPTDYASFSENFILSFHTYCSRFIIILLNPINLGVYMCVYWVYTELKANLRRMYILAILDLTQDRTDCHLLLYLLYICPILYLSVQTHYSLHTGPFPDLVSRILLDVLFTWDSEHHTSLLLLLSPASLLCAIFSGSFSSPRTLALDPGAQSWNSNGFWVIQW